MRPSSSSANWSPTPSGPRQPRTAARGTTGPGCRWWSCGWRATTSGWCAGGEVGQVAGDLLGAFDGVQGGGGQAAAVGGDGGVGVEQGDEGGDVTGLPCVFEVADDGGLAGGGGRGGVGGADAAAAGG